MSNFSDLYRETVPGSIITWISANTEPDPTMFLECNGVTLSILPKYEALFNVIGNVYGGDGIYTFALPDYRERFLRGKDTSDDVGDTQNAGLKSHTHTATGAPKKGGTGSGWNVVVIKRFPLAAEIGRSSSTVGATIGTEVKPKTMYVKYYIGY